MKKVINIKNLSSILTVSVFVLLLMFSPCKIRNYIQATLGIPQTSVLNKNQTTLNNANCTSAETINLEIIQHNQNSFKELLPIVIKQIVLVLNPRNLSINIHPLTQQIKHTVSFVPFYILYQNIKIYH